MLFVVECGLETKYRALMMSADLKRLNLMISSQVEDCLKGIFHLTIKFSLLQIMERSSDKVDELHNTKLLRKKANQFYDLHKIL